MESAEKKNSRSCFARFWHDGHAQLRNDIRMTWRFGSLRFLAAVWLAGLVLSLAILLQLGSSKSRGVIRKPTYQACRPDDTFSLFPQDYTYFSSSGFFQITLGYGQLSFAEAKVIDVAWDIVCGRGGQFVIAFISWHVFANYVTTSMEIAPVTFSTYRTVFLQNESMMLAVPRLLRDFTRRRRLHSKLAMVFMIITMLFIWIFPSFASSMTGYSGNVKAYIQDDASNYIPFNTFERPLFIVHDGDRIGESKDLAVFVGQGYAASYTDEPVLADFPRETNMIVNCNHPVADETLSCVLVNYVRRYQWNDSSQLNSSRFNGTDLEGPILNISAYYHPYRTPEDTVWRSDNITYTFEQLMNQGTCQPLKTYQWGFSYIQLIIMLILLILWATGIGILHIQSHYTLLHRGKTDVAGTYKAILELADAMTTHLLQTGSPSPKHILALSETELCARFDKDARGGAIAYQNVRVLHGDEKLRVGFLRTGQSVAPSPMKREFNVQWQRSVSVETVEPS
ncbi:hypothetical protein NX059_011873 [Plenodomus lindquistii]|nr:hypothetical protein NX059_011873 [Plenodomus lindquistii]